jgi:hypothetical protein
MIGSGNVHRQLERAEPTGPTGESVALAGGATS